MKVTATRFEDLVVRQKAHQLILSKDLEYVDVFE